MRKADHPVRPRLIVTALAIAIAGLLLAALAALAASRTQPAIIVVAALMLGSGYGCCQAGKLACAEVL